VITKTRHKRKTEVDWFDHDLSDVLTTALLLTQIWDGLNQQALTKNTKKEWLV
jgi:hypothetical protein